MTKNQLVEGLRDRYGDIICETQMDYGDFQSVIIQADSSPYFDLLTIECFLTDDSNVIVVVDDFVKYYDDITEEILTDLDKKEWQKQALT